jgi:hypothetical protein
MNLLHNFAYTGLQSGNRGGIKSMLMNWFYNLTDIDIESSNRGDIK